MNVNRATALIVVLIAVAVGGSSCAGDEPEVNCEASEGPITHGPRVGAVTDSTAKIWVRACREVDVNAQFRVAGDSLRNVQEGAATKTDLSADGTVVVEITALEPATTYEYEILVDGEPDASLAGTFATMPAPNEGTVTFVFGADTRPEGSRAAFDSMATAGAMFALFIGDQIYVDPQLPPEDPHFDAEGKEDYEAVYRTAWAEPTFRSFMSSTPTYLMWDDHEILNDWDSQTEDPYSWALAAYDEYQHSGNPESFREGALYYVIRAGAAELFVLDERSYRSANNQRDDDKKTMLGFQQKADLQTWLLNSTARFKFIVSPVMWSDYAKHTEEAWISFKNERNQILDYVREHRVPGVVLLSGDEHWTGVFRLQPWGLYELGPTPLAGFSGAATDQIGPAVLFKLGQAAVFGSVSIDATACPATLNLRVTDAFGQTRYELPLTEGDLVEPALSPAEYCAAYNAGRLDSDADGCADAVERGNDETLGGRRDPLYHWDVYDVNHDRRVDNLDALAVSDAIGVRIEDGEYDPALDRSEAADGAEPWEAGPPDGVIDDTDFFLVTAQVGMSCALPE